MSEKLGQDSAYPYVDRHCIIGNNMSGSFGMSKRFYAACAAMQGMLSHSTRYHCRPEDSHLTWKQGMIKEAYDLADELLRQENE